MLLRQNNCCQPLRCIIYLEKQDQYAKMVSFRKLITFTAHNNTEFLVTTALPTLQYKMVLVQVHVSFISLFSSLQSLRKAFKCVQCCSVVTGANAGIGAPWN